MDRFGLSEDEQERLWELWGAGRSLRAIARDLGHRPQQIFRYVWFTGGRRPVPRRRAPGCLSGREREEISRGLAGGLSCRQIALDLGRSSSTISREVARNGGQRRYRAAAADVAGWERARRPKPTKLAGWSSPVSVDTG